MMMTHRFSHLTVRTRVVCRSHEHPAEAPSKENMNQRHPNE
jgi:hypothetical protein